MFDITRAAQAIAFLANKAGQSMPATKLVTLLYAADRSAMRQHGEPITGDAMIALPDGPSLGWIRELLSGGKSLVAVSDWISVSSEGVTGRRVTTTADFDELSQADIAILDETWATLGGMAPDVLARHARDSFCEWVAPVDGQAPIRPQAVFVALGYEPSVAARMAEHLLEVNQLQEVVSGLL